MPSPDNFRVPWARDATGRLVQPAGAPPGDYRCPECASPLVHRSGTRRPHFAHKKNPDRPCSLESVLHKIAKELIRQAIVAWRDGHAPSPVVTHRCTTKGCAQTIDLPLPDKIASAVLERRLDDRWVADVVLLDAGGNPLGAVEVVVTHEMEEEKRSSLTVPWIELSGQAIVEDPLRWVALRVSRGRLCADCAHFEEQKARGTAHAWEIVRGLGWIVPSLQRGYTATITRCYRCHHLTPVFAWSGPWPPEPRPRTIRLDRAKSSSSSRRSWENHCVHCEALQHHFYVEQAFFFGDGREIS